ncbi:MAG: HD domain-containing protein [Clostridiaceae bacterium]|jgi:metal-dependent HD superfamily phosphatase/phosphodiesterase|nr:HD domain-containing protein [Clostridiaceae bacterium]
MEYKKISFEDIRNNNEVKTYIKYADKVMDAMGYTEHSFAHVTKTAVNAAEILARLGYDERTVELAKIAGYMHDIGNVVNRHNHAHSGALMAFRILGEMGMDPEDASVIVSAIGNHDENSATPVNAVAAALILADKSDVRRTRVRARENTVDFDIHDRVNHAVYESDLIMDTNEKTVTLKLNIDTSQCSVMEYFEIFINRMLLCRRAAEYLGLEFKLVINGAVLL